MTPGSLKEDNPKCDRDITIFGYLRGANLKQGARLHLAGVGDYTVGSSSLALVVKIGSLLVVHTLQWGPLFLASAVEISNAMVGVLFPGVCTQDL
jgi:hypothetical protein